MNERVMELTGGLTLHELLNDPTTFPWDHALFVDYNEPLTLDTICLLHDIDDIDDAVDDETELPAVAIEIGFDYVLSVADIQSIVSNSRAQIPDRTPEQLLEALEFYLDNDAFIPWYRPERADLPEGFQH